MRDVTITGNQITSIDVSKNIDLHTLYCGSVPITSLDISNNDKLYYLVCTGSQLSELNISNNPYLIDVYKNGTRTDFGDII